MDPRRRQKLGGRASAALPVLWAAKARNRWTDAELARQLGVTTAAVAGLLYGDFRPGRRVTERCRSLLEIEPALWDEPVPPRWRPRHLARVRPARRDLPPTGTG